MQQYQLSEATRKAINSRVGETFRLLKEASQNLVDSEGKSLSNAEKYAVVIEALQFVIRNRDPNIDPPQNYTKGHQLLADVDGKLESVYDDPTTLDENLQGQTITSSVQLYLRTLIRICIANIEADLSVILREVNKNFPNDTNDEKKNVPVVPENTQVVPTNVQNNLPAQNDLSTSVAIIGALPPVMAAASSSSSSAQPLPASSASSSSSNYSYSSSSVFFPPSSVSLSISDVSASYSSGGLNPEYDYLLKLAIVGRSGAGKTAIIDRFVKDQFSECYTNTKYNDFSIKLIFMRRKNIKLQIWDLPNTLRRGNRFRGAHGVIVVFDVTNRKSFEDVRPTLAEISDIVGDQACYILVGTKSDKSMERVVSRAEMYVKAQELGFSSAIEVSSKNNNNIQELFALSTIAVLNKLNPDSFPLEEPPQELPVVPEKKCCIM